jgi:hypothetical protein
MAVDQPEEPVPDCDVDLPLADELNKRADALITRIDQHLEMHRHLYRLKETSRIAAEGQDEIPG